MSIRKYLETSPLFEIIRYDDKKDLKKDCVTFSGAPRKHPYDNEKMLLILSPFSSDTVFYEFTIKDIVDYENLPNIITENGENLQMTKIWVKKGSFGLKFQPFEVDMPLKYFKDSELLHQTFSTDKTDEKQL